MITEKELEQKVYELWGRRFSIRPERFSESGSIIITDKELQDSNDVVLYQLNQFSVVRIDPVLADLLELADLQEGLFRQPELCSLVRKHLGEEATLEMDDSGRFSCYYLQGDHFKPFSASGNKDPVMLDTESDRELIRAFCQSCPPGDVEAAELEEEDEPDAVSFGYIIEGKLMAYSGFRYWDEEFGDIGVLTHPEMRGRGLAKSATSRLCKWCLEHDVIPMHRAFDENLGSSCIPVSLGFTRMMIIDRFKVVQP